MHIPLMGTGIAGNITQYLMVDNKHSSQFCYVIYALVVGDRLNTDVLYILLSELNKWLCAYNYVHNSNL